MISKTAVFKNIIKIKYITKFLCIVAIASAAILLTDFSSKNFEIKASQDGLPHFERAREIIIGEPTEDGYVTEGSKISILGACDTDYPLYLDGREIKYTEHGFFTVYVPLEIGSNTFTFTNGENEKSITINRKKASSGGGAGPSYIEYETPKSGVVTSDYLMPRVNTASSDVEYMPIVTGTEVLIYGEKGSYVKLADGTYVSASGVDIKDKMLPLNKVWGIRVKDDLEANCLVAEVKTNVNIHYKVDFYEDLLSLTLYGTISSGVPYVYENDTVSEVVVNAGTQSRYRHDDAVKLDFILKEGMGVCGYDVEFADGKMLFTIKKAPHLSGSTEKPLEGAKIVMDAGHGDHNLGATGPMGKQGPNEKHFNLDICLKISDILRSRGADVTIIRKDDTFYSLGYRVNVIRSVKPDISVSIHGNAVAYETDMSKISGYLTYYSCDMINSVPEFINEKVCGYMGFESELQQAKSLSLTRLTICPAVLLETKFLSNPDDYEFLLKESNRKMFAESIAQSIEDYILSVAAGSQE